jgi:GAF domain-containing protein
MRDEASVLDVILGNWNNNIATRYGELANASAYLKSLFDNISWVGFYLKDGENLKLGPFQGNLACSTIVFGKGVCGTAYSEKKTIVVENVHKFEGHIACDKGSNSEIVVPLKVNDEVVGLIDIDSTNFSRFSNKDKELLEELAIIIVNKLFR